jgi:hypothetical protein
MERRLTFKSGREIRQGSSDGQGAFGKGRSGRNGPLWLPKREHQKLELRRLKIGALQSRILISK